MEQPSSPGSNPVKVRNCIEELVKFTLQSHLNGTLECDVGLSKQFCSSLLNHHSAHPIADSPGASQNPLYIQLALALYEIITFGSLEGSSKCDKLASFCEGSDLKQKEGWFDLVHKNGSELAEILKSINFELHVQEPFFTQLKDPLFPAWERCNTLVLSWLLHSISPSIAKSILWFDTAVEVWNDLKARFSQGDAFRISELQEEIFSFRQNALSVTDYFTQLKVLWDELMNLRPILRCTCNPQCTCQALEKVKVYQENDHVICFLKGLNEGFTVLRSQILLIEPLPPINKVFAMVLQHERQINSVLPSSSLKVESTAFANKAIYNSSGRGSRRSISNVRRPLCTHCGYMGHTVEKCFKKHGFPPGFTPRSRVGIANHVDTVMSKAEDIRSVPDNAQNSGDLTSFPFTKDQYTKLLAMLQTADNASSPVTYANATSKFVCTTSQKPETTSVSDGLKTVEGRCAVGDYNRIASGALILFNKCLVLEVQDVHHYASFFEMLEAESLAKVLPGVKTIDEGIQVYRKFYSREKEMSNGVLAICVAKVAAQPYLSLARILSGLRYEGVLAF